MMHRSVDRMLNQEAAFTASLIRSFSCGPTSWLLLPRQAGLLLGFADEAHGSAKGLSLPWAGSPATPRPTSLRYIAHGRSICHKRTSRFISSLASRYAIFALSAAAPPPLRQNTLDCLPSKYQVVRVANFIVCPGQFSGKKRKGRTCQRSLDRPLIARR